MYAQIIYFYLTPDHNQIKGHQPPAK